MEEENEAISAETSRFPKWLKIIILIFVLLLIGAIYFIFVHNSSSTAVYPPEIKTCDDLPSGILKEECYFNLAKTTENSAICQKISNYPDCIAIVEQNSDKCENDGCIFQIAVAKKDSTICDKIKSSDITAVTKTSCLEEVGRSSLNISVCRIIPDEPKAIPSSGYRDNCYKRIAETTNNLSVCKEELQLFGNADSCYYRMAIINANNATCEKVIDTNQKYMCYYGISYLKYPT